MLAGFLGPAGPLGRAGAHAFLSRRPRTGAIDACRAHARAPSDTPFSPATGPHRPYQLTWGGSEGG